MTAIHTLLGQVLKGVPTDRPCAHPITGLRSSSTGPRRATYEMHWQRLSRSARRGRLGGKTLPEKLNSVLDPRSVVGRNRLECTSRVSGEVRKRRQISMDSSTAPKTRILFLAADPRDRLRPAFDCEHRKIEAKLRAADYRDSLEFISKWAVQTDDLLQALNEHRPHIVHFSGHGTAADELLLMDDEERANRSPPRPLPDSSPHSPARFGWLC